MFPPRERLWQSCSLWDWEFGMGELAGSTSTPVRDGHRLAHHTSPAVPGAVGAIVHDELDDVELVVVGSDVGLVQGAVIVLIDLWQAADWGGTEGFTHLGAWGSPLVLSILLPSPDSPPHTHLCIRPCTQGTLPINGGGGLLLGGCLQGSERRAPGILLLLLPPLGFLAPISRLGCRGCSALGGHGPAAPVGRQLLSSTLWEREMPGCPSGKVQLGCTLAVLCL